MKRRIYNTFLIAVVISAVLGTILGFMFVNENYTKNYAASVDETYNDINLTKTEYAEQEYIWIITCLVPDGYKLVENTVIVDKEPMAINDGKTFKIWLPTGDIVYLPSDKVWVIQTERRDNNGKVRGLFE